jgi:HAD superfamily hydrolase (TIGR01549 family)
MLEAVLFDLDDTLLGNPMDTFVPAYFQALMHYFDHLLPPERLIADMMRATKAMDADHHRALTNEEAFASVFYPLLGQDRATVESAFERFYALEFPKLRRLARRRPEARSLVVSAFERGLQVVIATNPMFPRVAVEERLAWAGVPVQDFDYALVTTYENMHATKSHLAYYREILEKLGRRAPECLMVGDNWKMDIAPASSVGLHVYWVTDEKEPPAPNASLVGRGTLADLWRDVQAQGWTVQPEAG